jgi:hypothetical protein
MKKLCLIISIFTSFAVSVQAEDRLELETTIIKGNKELPQILYVVPWQDIKRSRKKEQQIVLYSLFGDLFDPVNPDTLQDKDTINEVSQLKP